MALPLFSTEPGRPGIIAIGGDAIGIVAIGVSATGILAFGVQARGLIAIACGASVGAVAISFGASVGLFATAVGCAGGLWGGAYGIELPLWPGPFPRRLRDQGQGEIEGIKPGESRWLLVKIERVEQGWSILHQGKPLEATLLGEAQKTAIQGPARVLVRAAKRDPEEEKDTAGTLEVAHLEPLTTLLSARLLWGVSLLARIGLLLALAWFLGH